MNCLEFRRLLEIQPDSKEPEFLRHKAECESCAEAAVKAARFSATMTRAACIDVPENLASRILLRQSFSGSSRFFSRRSALALAAGITVAAALVLSGTYVLRKQDPLAREIFTRIHQASDAQESQIPLDSAAVAKALAPVGLEVIAKPGKVTYAGESMLRGRVSGHIVLQGEWAPCTVFLIPEINVASNYTIRDGDLKGVIVPFNGGVIAIVGALEESLEPVVERIRAAFRWRRV